jgi:hypothetical protein
MKPKTVEELIQALMNLPEEVKGFAVALGGDDYALDWNGRLEIDRRGDGTVEIKSEES